MKFYEQSKGENMGLANLVLDIPSNVEIIKNSMMRW
nr:MAG TPA: hypothetical protein [Caudoviricetes sp.]